MSIETLEAKKLQDAIVKAMAAYFEYLERNGLIWDGEYDLYDEGGTPLERASTPTSAFSEIM